MVCENYSAAISALFFQELVLYLMNKYTNLNNVVRFGLFLSHFSTN